MLGETTDTFPTMKDVEQGRAVDAGYGDPAVPGTKANGILQGDFVRIYNSGKNLTEQDFLHLPAPKEVQDYLYGTYLATRRSGVASLGFDPRRAVMSYTDQELNVGGVYFPETDLMWGTTAGGTSAMTHESIHRGLKLLRDSGVDVPKGQGDEIITRALMLKNFGEVEVNNVKQRWVGLDLTKAAERMPKEWQAAKAFLDKNREYLDELEDKAAALYKKRNRDMGPR